ncbi:MAG: DivIVA domain-containing protein [Hamadaea sp.]|uniref:DivIVA domain-containing protein n=1 Tax=Hamadaea sp. NPDC050747 TaxID=3155789 RepID=UPI00183AED32|nr:DivIVA domain-containing protein [Hamadaea sp.]NUR48476.1 DivIVA domain-containing protein [Hamadaea sp.]NUT06094.1 DivIVA domain-containing protein [Hamadaea sp.]
MGQLLTPEDIRTVAFRKPALGRRGYDEEGVDAFLDAVEQTLTVLYAEIARLRSGVQPVYEPPASTSDGAVLGELAQIRASLARIEAAVGPHRGGDPLF